MKQQLRLLLPHLGLQDLTPKCRQVAPLEFPMACNTHLQEHPQQLVSNPQVRGRAEAAGGALQGTALLLLLLVLLASPTLPLLLELSSRSLRCCQQGRLHPMQQVLVPQVVHHQAC